MSAKITPVIELLQKQFSDIDFAPAPLLEMEDQSKEQWCVKVGADKLMAVMSFLRSDERCAFEQLSDLAGVDYLNFPNAKDRYGVTYSLLSLSNEHRLWVKVFVNDPNPEVPSVVSIWHGATWMEREVWDMFGVRFTDHPDLRRILTWEGFEAHPLRKDYPLTGRGERENFKVITRESA